MSPVRPVRKRSSALRPILAVVGVLIFGGLAAVGSLWAAGFDFAMFSNPVVKEERPTVAIPASARRIAAYSRVTREDLFDLSRKEFSFFKMRPEQTRGAKITGRLPEGEEVSGTVEEVHVQEDGIVFHLNSGQELSLAQVTKLGGAFMRHSDIIGRVLDHEKPTGYGFTESDFMPEGTRSGMSAGVPPGKRAITLEADRLGGIHALRAGDHLDILATYPVEKRKSADKPNKPERRPGGLLIEENPAAAPRADVNIIVEAGLIVTPVHARPVPQSAQRQTSARPIQDVVIAVGPEEVAALSEAMAAEATLTVVAHSGHPDDPGGSISLPESKRPKPKTSYVVEVIRGNKRETLVVDRRQEAIDAEAPSDRLTLGDK